MQNLDIAASEHCLGQAEPTENPMCALDGGIMESAFRSQCPLCGCPFPHHPETSKRIHYPEGEELTVNSQRVFLGHSDASDQNPSQTTLRKTAYVNKEPKGPARLEQEPKAGPRSYSSISLQNWFQETRIPRT